jgi:SMC interacting uncharacterized protein involved in chromosome segregation
MDPDTVWHSLGAGAILGTALTFARLLLDYAFRGGERRLEHDDRRRSQERDAEARLERILQDRLSDADRRLERCELDAQAERVRCATLEHEQARVLQAHELLKEQYAVLQADHAQLLRKQRLLLEQLERLRLDGTVRGCDAA